MNVLILRGARPSQRDSDGKTALDVAKANDDEEFLEAISLATEAPSAELSYGPADFDLVRATEALVDERALTDEIIGGAYELDGRSAQDLLDESVAVAARFKNGT